MGKWMFVAEDLEEDSGEELLIDATTGHEVLSFMDGSFGYNQIRMSPEDDKLTTFHTPKGIYCYKVMPFGLKNAGAMYQRAMHKIFNDMIYKTLNAMSMMWKVFKRLRRYQLKMNPLKCAFGVTSRKFLGFIIRHREIKIEQAKIDAILKMPESQNIHELKSLQEKLVYIQRFISNLARRCQPFSHLTKKSVPFEWDKVCSNAFNSIKVYLMKPPALAMLVPGCSLVLHIAAQEHSIGALLAQENDNGKENTLYYLSRMMTPNELKYSPIEKICLALIFANQKLKHNFQAHTVRIVSKANPLEYVMTRLALFDRLVVRGQVIVDFLANHPIPTEWELSDDLPDEDVLTLILGLEMIVDIKQLRLRVYGDSKLVVNQLLGTYEVKKPELLPYFNYANRLIGWLGDVEIEHIPRAENNQTDALAKFASMLPMLEKEAHISICRSHEEKENHIVEVFEIENEDWRQSLVDYLKYEKLPDDLCHRTDIW
ncbi:DNA-directed DNA polymerase [Handroanthus impetiginosus]|uniref:DNA-directed DNA polymerase n=1 Tax=Handroanthus impetiginosus TaxID=429701 RepID=A0A2G9I4Z8_9LAMI|nr:DNA-directed DNA polymerase [Handroanthus impetiginosus]